MAKIPRDQPTKDQEERLDMRLKWLVAIGFVAFITLLIIGAGSLIEDARSSLKRPMPPTDLRAE